MDFYIPLFITVATPTVLVAALASSMLSRDIENDGGQLIASILAWFIAACLSFVMPMPICVFASKRHSKLARDWTGLALALHLSCFALTLSSIERLTRFESRILAAMVVYGCVVAYVLEVCLLCTSAKSLRSSLGRWELDAFCFAVGNWASLVFWLLVQVRPSLAMPLALFDFIFGPLISIFYLYATLAKRRDTAPVSDRESAVAFVVIFAVRLFLCGAKIGLGLGSESLFEFGAFMLGNASLGVLVLGSVGGCMWKLTQGPRKDENEDTYHVFTTV
jgi:hypothetical protein